MLRPDTHNPRKHAGSRSGQVMLFFIMILVILVFMVLWNFDLHKILHVKNVTQNGGDAAALMASRWQGITLNVVGDLNLMQAVALSTGDTNTVAAITNMQARLLFVGPMVALQTSQQAAKNNGIFPNDPYTQFIFSHADTVRHEYTRISRFTGEMLCPEPYPDAWAEYADMLDLIAAEGVAAGPDNMRLFFDVSGGHTLYDIGFYNAIAGRTWCWFYRNAPSLLADYANFFPPWWSPLPDPPERQYLNSEFYSLHLEKTDTSLETLGLEREQLETLAEDRALETTAITTSATHAAAWYVYGEEWDDWTAMATDGADPFPIAGPVRDVYNYSGADAAVRVAATMERLTPGQGSGTISNTLTWTAAAKPFGSLNDGNNRPIDFRLVLPAFRDVRLIPVDASSAPAGGSFNLEWRNHIEGHLPEYMARGPAALSSSCYYCRQLKTWESVSFRQTGLDWLDENSHLCTLPSGDGDHRGGGTQHGH